MKATASTRTILLLMILLVFPLSLSAEPFVFQKEAPAEPKEEPQTQFSVGAKGYIIKKYHKEVLAEKIIHYIR